MWKTNLIKYCFIDETFYDGMSLLFGKIEVI